MKVVTQNPLLIMIAFIDFVCHINCHWTSSILVFGVLVPLFFGVSLVIRRLFFHPLADFPGPRLAAVTSFYKTYYEVVKGGEMLQQIEYLHSRYGMYTTGSLICLFRCSHLLRIRSAYWAQ